MAGFIIKLTNNSKDYYLEWCNSVDAPLIYGCSLEIFKNYYEEKYGSEGMTLLKERLERVEKKGTSSMLHDDPYEHFPFNSAGENGEELSANELIKHYCR